ncbi:MAG TPA: DUF6683 family protein [Dongiaceae bacterium]|nr:DUF6683 family protein [Dongiaceae bacterium]
MTMWCRSAFGAAAILALCSACTSYTVYPTFAKVTDYPQHAHQKEQIVLLMSDEVPADPYDSVGQVEVTRSDWASNQDMFDAMRDLAVKYGFDGISGIVCGPDAVVAYRCDGQAFIYTTAAAAPPAPAAPVSTDTTGAQYAEITGLKLTEPPADPCAVACSAVAADERAKSGPAPAAPLYRTSATQAATGRRILIENLVTDSGATRASAETTVPDWDEVVSEWRDVEPKGNYQPNDVADVFAKYWFFSWVFGGGADPKVMTETAGAGIRAQAHRLFATDPTLSSMTEGERQAMAEAMMRVQTTDWLTLMAANEAKVLGPAMEAVKQQFQEEFGLDITQLGLTAAQGFVMKAGAGSTTP